MSQAPVPTPDGSATLWSERYGQHYHNRHGALTQSRHVFLHGTHTDSHPAPRVLEIGFGAGMNFLTTLQNVAERGVPLHYIACEFDPLPVATLRVIGATHPGSNHPVWQTLLAVWPEVPSSMDAQSALSAQIAQPSQSPRSNERVRAAPIVLDVQRDTIHVEIHFADATTTPLPEQWASAIYLDGFSPAANPELWTPTFIAHLARAMQTNAWLATYSSAGNVRRALQSAGLQVTRSPGMAGKREFLQAHKANGCRT